MVEETEEKEEALRLSGGDGVSAAAVTDLQSNLRVGIKGIVEAKLLVGVGFRAEGGLGWGLGVERRDGGFLSTERERPRFGAGAVGGIMPVGRKILKCCCSCDFRTISSPAAIV